jgi:hypothetical protein
MTMFRGRASYTATISLLALALSYGCGSGDDDSATTPNTGGTAGTKATGGDSGTDASGGAVDVGGGKGGTDGTGGSTGGASGSGAKGGTSASGGSGAKGGAAGSSGTTGVSGNTNDLLDAIGEACKADCDAQFESDCAPANSNRLTCQLSCASSTTQLGDFCLAEYRDYVTCRGEGGYDCITSGTTTYPYQRSTCALEQQAFSLCTQHLGCKRYCKQVLDLGCNDTPLEDCIDACTAEDTSLPSGCIYRTENIASCQATSGAVCEDDHLSTPAACATQVLSVAECISDDSDDLCDGWCWAADRLGCGAKDCTDDCASKKAPAMCGSEWDSLLDCVLFFDEGGCESDRLVGNSICASEQTAYDSCVKGDAGTP